MRGLKSAVSGMTGSTGSGSDEGTLELDTRDFDAESPGRGVAMVGAFLVLVTIGWLVRRSRRRTSSDELAYAES